MFTIIGDGSFGMAGFEIETAVRSGINTITSLYNNSGLDVIRRLQDRRKEQPLWDNLGGSYAEIARGMGAYAVKVEKPENISPTLEDAEKWDKPVLLKFMVKKKSRH